MFLEISNFDIGKRAFHIDLGRNYAIVADYDGKVSFIDVFTLEKQNLLIQLFLWEEFMMENSFML